MKKGYLFIANGRVVPKEQLMSMEPVRTGSFNWAYMYAADKMGWKLYQGINRTFADKLKCLDFDITYYDQHIFRNIFDIRSNWTAYKNLCRFLKAHPDIEIIHCNTPIGGVIGRICGHKFKKKVIYTAHGFHFYKGAPLVNRTVFKWVEMFLAHYTDVLITINHEDYEAAKKFRLKQGGKVCFIPGVGIDLNGFKIPEIELRKEKRTELGLQEDDIALISMGDLVARKNYGFALEVIAAAGNPKINYLVCGDGPEQDALVAFAETLGIERQVHFLGRRNDVKDLLYCSDIFLFTTSQEGLTRSAMEAMAAGLPCLMSDVRGNRDLMEDGKGGFLCKLEEKEFWLECLLRLAADQRLRIDMGLWNIEHVKRFDISNIQEMSFKVFCENMNQSAWGGDNRTSIKYQLLSSLHLPIDSRLIMVVGDLNDNKNVQTIIKAMSMCPADYHLLICGTGPLESKLRALATQTNVDRRCHFLGFRSDVKTLLMISDLFVMASKREGLPRSTMEAMAAGLPCVVSKIRGNVDLIDEGEGGYTIVPNYYEGFANAINRILSDGVLAKRMGAYNRNKIRQFSIDKVEVQVVETFNEI